MVKVNVLTNNKRSTVIANDTDTLRKILTEEGVEIGRGGLTIDGIPLQIGDLDKTISALGVGDNFSVYQVVKADNAY